jgi:hypothetical protein
LFIDMIDQREKTLVFCANQAHALAMRDLINQMKTNPDPSYCHRVTADDGVLGEQQLPVRAQPGTTGSTRREGPPAGRTNPRRKAGPPVLSQTR